MASVKQIFITGIAGFVGFHLGMALKKRGDSVIGCDNFNAYYSPKLKEKRKEALQKAGVEVLSLDVCDVQALRTIWSKHSVTHCVHLAAQAGVRASNHQPEKYVHANLVGLLSILDVMRNTPHIPFIFASSSSVYGTNEKIPFAEEDTTNQPASLYGVTKKIGEEILYSYHRLYGIPCTVLRFFTVYGPWGRPDMAYFSFTKALLEELPIPIFGDGKALRDSTYIDDIVQGILAAIDYGARWEIFNLGAHRPHTVLEMIAYLEEFTRKKAQLHFLPMPPGDVPRTHADIRKSQRRLGFAPSVPLKIGLKHFVDWFLTKEV